MSTHDRNIRVFDRESSRAVDRAAVEQYGMPGIVLMENAARALAASALEAGQPDEFCRRLFESHASLRDLYEVSCPELDAVVDAVETLAKRTGDPLLGARMTGGGFGGCAVVCCPPAIPDRVAEVIAGHFRDAFGREPMIMPARACRGSSNVQI